MNIEKVMQTLNNRLSSMNSTPVDSARITVQEFQAIQDHIDYLEALVTSMESVNVSRSAVYESKQLRQ